MKLLEGMSQSKVCKSKNVSVRDGRHDNDRCYCQDTIEHLKNNEKRFTYPAIKMVFPTDPSNDEYSKRCALNTFRQRTIEWMISIQDYFTNCEETLEMATRLFDFIFYNDFYASVKPTDYGSAHETEKKYYQEQECLHLVAITCYFLSCKFWERFPPKLSKLIGLTEYAYSEMQLLQMERQILMKLDFDLKIPLISQYIEFYMLHEKEFFLSKIMIVSHYLSNLALTEMIFTNRLSSSLAAVILTLSKMILNLFAATHDPDSRELYTHKLYDVHLFEVENFYEILTEIWQIFMNSMTNYSSFRLQKRKFSEQKYCYLNSYLEGIDLQQLQMHFKDLTFKVKTHLEYKNRVVNQNFMELSEFLFI